MRQPASLLQLNVCLAYHVQLQSRDYTSRPSSRLCLNTIRVWRKQQEKYYIIPNPCMPVGLGSSASELSTYSVSKASKLGLCRLRRFDTANMSHSLPILVILPL